MQVLKFWHFRPTIQSELQTTPFERWACVTLISHLRKKKTCKDNYLSILDDNSTLHVLVVSVGRLFVRKAIRCVLSIHRGHCAERASKVFPTGDFVRPQIAKILRNVNKSNVALDTTVETANDINSIALGIGMSHGMSVSGRWWASDYLHILCNKANPEITGILVSDKRVRSIMRILSASENHHVLVRCYCWMQEARLRLKFKITRVKYIKIGLILDLNPSASYPEYTHRSRDVPVVGMTSILVAISSFLTPQRNHLEACELAN